MVLRGSTKVSTPIYLLLVYFQLVQSTNELHRTCINWNPAVFAGKDASRALACSSLKPEECRPEWYDLEDKDKKVLEEWFTFFSKRYNIVGKVKDAKNY